MIFLERYGREIAGKSPQIGDQAPQILFGHPVEGHEGVHGEDALSGQDAGAGEWRR